jgi:hypothetical protein
VRYDHPKNCASGRDPALRGFWKCTAHPAAGGTALSKTPRALADGLMLAFQQLLSLWLLKRNGQ